MSFLIDTNVVSELQKGARADPNVVAWFARSDENEIFLSVLTLGEIRRGMRVRDAGIGSSPLRWRPGWGESPTSTRTGSSQ